MKTKFIVCLFIILLTASTSHMANLPTKTAANLPESTSRIHLDSFQPYWRTIPIQNGPTPRYDNMMAFDSKRNVTIVAGGNDGVSALNDAWQFNHTDYTWTQIADLPVAIAGGAMAYDPDAELMYIFGGMDDTNTVLDAIFFYDGFTWVTDVLNLPVGVYRPAAVYNPLLKVMYISGGLDATSSTSNSVLEYNATDISVTQIKTFSGQGLYGHAMVYIPTYEYDPILFPGDYWGSQLIIIGGYSSSNIPYTNGQQSMVYSDGTMDPFNLMGGGVPGNAGSEMLSAYDPNTHLAYFYGGNDGNYFNNLFTGEISGPSGNLNTNNITLEQMPPARSMAGMVYDFNENFFLLFGGTDDGGLTIFEKLWQLHLQEPQDLPKITSGPSDTVFEQSVKNTVEWWVDDNYADWYTIEDNGSVIQEGTWVTGNISLDIKDFELGVHDFKLWINNTKGYETNDSVWITIEDNTLPLISSPSDFSVDVSKQVTIEWNVTEDNPMSYEIWVDSVLNETNTLTTNSVQFSNYLAIGTHAIKLVVKDTSLNVAQDLVLVTVTNIDNNNTDTRTNTNTGTTTNTNTNPTSTDTNTRKPTDNNSLDVSADFPFVQLFFAIIVVGQIFKRYK